MYVYTVQYSGMGNPLREGGNMGKLSKLERLERGYIGGFHFLATVPIKHEFWEILKGLFAVGSFE